MVSQPNLDFFKGAIGFVKSKKVREGVIAARYNHTYTIQHILCMYSLPMIQLSSSSQLLVVYLDQHFYGCQHRMFCTTCTMCLMLYMYVVSFFNWTPQSLVNLIASNVTLFSCLFALRIKWMLQVHFQLTRIAQTYLLSISSSFLVTFSFNLNSI